MVDQMMNKRVGVRMWPVGHSWDHHKLGFHTCVGWLDAPPAAGEQTQIAHFEDEIGRFCICSRVAPWDSEHATAVRAAS